KNKSSREVSEILVKNKIATRNDNFYAWRCLKALGIDTEDGVVRISLTHYNTLRETQYPPIELFRQHNVSMALATDCNPGSSPIASLLLTMNMACTVFRLTPLEALQGVTKNAAKALGIKTHGILQAGAIANLAIWNIRHPKELAYRIGFNPLHKRVFKGKMQ
ncbi:MAG: amidohydrolase family protein, partial [Mariprofundaceae bacterium]|nr:amidohydrolase family protein [Mariprofundaceae bacterium]